MAGSLSEEEMLCDEIRNYPSLYNKKLKDYKDRLVQENCYNAVAGALPFITNGEEAKAEFERIRKKFSRKRVTLKKAQQSGTGRKEIEKAENDLNDYKFLFWLNEFTAFRSTTTNNPVLVPTSQGNVDLSQASQSCDDPIDDEVDNIDIPNTSSLPTAIETPQTSAKQKYQKVKGERKRKKPEDGLEELLMREIQKPCGSNPIESAELLFCKSIAADMEKLSERGRIRVKSDIRNIISKYQLEELDAGLGYDQNSYTRLSTVSERREESDMIKYKI